MKFMVKRKILMSTWEFIITRNIISEALCIIIITWVAKIISFEAYVGINFLIIRSPW